MLIKLLNPFDHGGVRYESLEVPDYLQVGHRRAYAKHKDLEAEEAGVALCAALCEIPEAAFDRVSLKDFERITNAVRDLFAGDTGKKSTSRPKNGTSRGS
jgi:hypothetical protein